MKRPPVIILCGGKGTRMGDLCGRTPKSMLLVQDKPFLALLVENLIKQGFSQFHFAVGHLSSLIEGHSWEADYPKCSFYYSNCDYVGTTNALYEAFTSSKLKKAWVVNGDTWLYFKLPEAKETTILMREGLDTGAHFYTRSVFKEAKKGFFDIGTPVAYSTFVSDRRFERIKNDYNKNPSKN